MVFAKYTHTHTHTHISNTVRVYGEYDRNYHEYDMSFKLKNKLMH